VTMCVILYLATSTPLAAVAAAELTVESVPDGVLGKLRDKLSLPHVSRVLAGTCSCDFPSMLVGELMPYEDWMGHSAEQRAREIGLLTALFGLVRGACCDGRGVELFPVCVGVEGEPAHGRHELRLGELDPARFQFAENFIHAIHA